jgi:hypothetical protein
MLDVEFVLRAGGRSSATAVGKNAPTKDPACAVIPPFPQLRFTYNLVDQREYCGSTSS